MTLDERLTQQLIDALTVAAPLAQRVAVTSRQQHEDNTRLLNAVVAKLQELRPGGTQEGA